MEQRLERTVVCTAKNGADCGDSYLKWHNVDLLHHGLALASKSALIRAYRRGLQLKHPHIGRYLQIRSGKYTYTHSHVHIDTFRIVDFPQGGIDKEAC